MDSELKNTLQITKLSISSPLTFGFTSTPPVLLKNYKSNNKII